MKKILLPLLAGFAIGLVLVAARRPPSDAMAVIIGVAVGIVASVPTSLLLVALLRRRQHSTGAALTTTTPAEEIQP